MTKDKFYHVVNGKTQPHKFKNNEFLTYEAVCFSIWGGMPLDVGWAISTQIYQNALNKLQWKEENS